MYDYKAHYLKSFGETHLCFTNNHRLSPFETNDCWHIFSRKGKFDKFDRAFLKIWRFLEKVFNSIICHEILEQ